LWLRAWGYQLRGTLYLPKAKYRISISTFTRWETAEPQSPLVTCSIILSYYMTATEEQELLFFREVPFIKTEQLLEFIRSLQLSEFLFTTKRNLNREVYSFTMAVSREVLTKLGRGPFPIALNEEEKAWITLNVQGNSQVGSDEDN
jgi:hypothetical protein